MKATLTKFIGATPHDTQMLEFLPPLAGLAQTPISPAPRAVSLVICGALFFALIWSCLARIDIVATARGRILAEGDTKIVQPAETGVVIALPVKDGDHVSAGQVLIEIDPEASLADQNKALEDERRARLDVARLSGLRAVFDQPQPPVLGPLPAAMPPQDVETARAMMLAQYEEYRAKLAALNTQIAGRESDIGENDAQIKKAKDAIPYLAELEGIYHNLLQDEFGKRTDWLLAKQRLVDQQNDVDILQEHRLQLSAALLALKQQRDQAIAEYQRQILTELAEAERKAVLSGEDRDKASHHAALQTLKSPIDGTVQQMSVHSLGGVVTTGQHLLSVVPDGHGVAIEVEVENKDIGFIQPGQPVEIKVETFPFSRYGTVRGRIVSIDHDSLIPNAPAAERRVSTDPAGTASSAPGYMVRIVPETSVLSVDGTTRALTPGMSVVADIKLGNRRVINYLLSPVMAHAHDAFQER